MAGRWRQIPVIGRNEPAHTGLLHDVRICEHEEVAVRYGRTVFEVNANAMTDWMLEFGEDLGWERRGGSRRGAGYGQRGKIVILLAARVNPRQSGHVAVVMPEIREADGVRAADGTIETPLRPETTRVR